MATLAEVQNNSTDVGRGVRWWATENNAEAAAAVTAIVGRLEQQGTTRRRRWLKASYMVNGVEVPRTFAYSMRAPFAGAAAPMDLGLYTEPYFNITAQAVDVFSNRIGKNKPWPMFLSQGGDYRTRMRCKKLGRYMDGLFSELQVYKETRACFKDACSYGISYLKTFVGWDGKIKVQRRMCDDILVDESEIHAGAAPKNLYEKCWYPVEDLLAAFTDPKDQVAILNAPKASTGVLWSTHQSDHVAVCEAWHLPSFNADGKPIGGRRILCIGDHILSGKWGTKDGKWDRPRFPFAVMRYAPSTSSWYGQSVFDQVVTIQKDLNDNVTVIKTAHRMFAFPRTLSHELDGTTNKDYANVIAPVIKWKGQNKPEFVTPASMHQSIYDWCETDIARGFRRVGLSEQAAGGVKQPGLEAGVALRTWNQIEDARHVQLGQYLEELVVDITLRVLDLCKVVKPVVRLRGYRDLQITWGDVELPDEQWICKVFPISSIPQLPEGRIQTIEDWAKNGQISKRDKMRLDDMPDLDAYTSIADASADWVDWTLDNMIESGEYSPPEYYCDLDAALETAKGRYLHECTLGLPEDRLDLLRTFIDQVKDMQDLMSQEQASAAPAPAAPQQAPGAPAGQSQGAQPGAMAA